MNFAISNQFYVLAESYGLDFQRIYGAVTHRYPRMKSFAKPALRQDRAVSKHSAIVGFFRQQFFFSDIAAMPV